MRGILTPGRVLCSGLLKRSISEDADGSGLLVKYDGVHRGGCVDEDLGRLHIKFW
jgi:hypothetical protein